MECELCGKKSGSQVVVIDGSLLRVCNVCAKFGSKPSSIDIKHHKGYNKTVPEIAIRLKSKPSTSVKDLFETMPADVLVADYSRRIRDARIKKGLTPENLGKLINEKRSVINNLESGIIKPDDKLIAKLERALHIKLREKPVDVKLKKKASAALTIGDLIRVEDEKD
jgi:putative transcription factor